MTVPSRSVWSGPAADRDRSVPAFSARPREPRGFLAGWRAGRRADCDSLIRAVAVPPVARTTAAAMSSSDASSPLSLARRRTGGVRNQALRLRASARHDVAREQALVLAPLPLRDDGILRRRGRRFVVSRLDRRRGRGAAACASSACLASIARSRSW